MCCLLNVAKRFFRASISCIRAVPLKLTIAQQPAQPVFIASQSIDDIACQTKDFMNIVEFPREKLYNLPGLEAAVVEQIGQPLLACVGNKTFDDFPTLIAFISFGCYSFKVLRYWYLFLASKCMYVMTIDAVSIKI